MLKNLYSLSREKEELCSQNTHEYTWLKDVTSDGGLIRSVGHFFGMILRRVRSKSGRGFSAGEPSMFGLF